MQWNLMEQYRDMVKYSRILWNFLESTIITSLYTVLYSWLQFSTALLIIKSYWWIQMMYTSLGWCMCIRCWLRSVSILLLLFLFIVIVATVSVAAAAVVVVAAAAPFAAVIVIIYIPCQIGSVYCGFQVASTRSQTLFPLCVLFPAPQCISSSDTLIFSSSRFFLRDLGTAPNSLMIKGTTSTSIFHGFLSLIFRSCYISLLSFSLSPLL